jgi:tetratricopeptide (TPR) repeat protein
MLKKQRIFLLLVTAVFIFYSPCYAEFYRYNIDELARKAKVRIKEIEQKIWEEQAAAKLQEILSKAKTLYDEAEALYKQRKYEEAATVYKKIERMSRDPKIARWLDKKTN